MGLAELNSRLAMMDGGFDRRTVHNQKAADSHSEELP
jgi:hypothetical protein